MTELAGALRERVAIERMVGTPDGAGGVSGGWTPLADMWAAVALDGFGAAVEAERVSRAARYRVTIRESGDVGMGDRVRWRGRALRVLSVGRDPAWSERVEILAEETKA